MYEIKRHTREVSGVQIETFSREIWSNASVEVEAGTNGYKGGDFGHGSRTYFRIQNLTSADLQVNVINPGGAYSSDGGVEVILGGDDELCTIIEALEFILQALKDQRSEVE